MNTDPAKPRDLSDQISFAAIRGMLWVLRHLPYRTRVRFSGWLVSHMVAPLVGWRRRIADNLHLVAPETARDEVRRIQRSAPDNFGRNLAELFSPEEFLPLARATVLEGPGLTALEQARSEGRPAIIVSGHFGNYEVIRAGLIARGFRVGAIYRPMNNPPFNALYMKYMSMVGQPLFARGRRGMAEMMRFLKSGGTVAALIDQRLNNGVPLQFFGHRAYTALSIAELALKFEATVVPCYAIRQPDGLSFKAILEAPLPLTTPEDMTQALNDGLEKRVRQHMGQWLWFHNRWKEIPAAKESTT